MTHLMTEEVETILSRLLVFVVKVGLRPNVFDST